MLPFLKPKKMASVIIASRRNDSTMPEKAEDEQTPELQKFAEQMLQGIGSKDSTAVAEAIRGAHAHLTKIPDQT